MNTTRVNNKTVQKLTHAYQGFSFRLLSQLAQDNVDKNVLISPMSVAIALAMTYNGARGTTEQAIAKALGFEELSLEEVNAANQWLLSALDNLDSQIQWDVANSLWVQQSISLNENFSQNLKVAYTSEVTHLDFDDPKAELTINRWVAEKTQEKIKELVTSDHIRGAILVLTNAIYFKGLWTRPFDQKWTKKERFNLSDGRFISHPMMSQSGRFSYCEREEFQAISLPYGNGQISMYIFLPTTSIEAFQTCLTAQHWQSWISQFSMMKGHLILPRFKIEYEALLNDVLIRLGMGEAFSGNANFEGIGAGPLTISQVMHKAVIEVNEEGTEAAAATVVITKRSLGTQPTFKMTVDRPFFYAIRDNQTGTLLFMGYVQNPASN